MSAVVGCRDLGRRIGRVDLLAEISLEAEAGALLAIVGPNGAGKTTLLHALAGDVRPDRGEVRWLDRPLASWSLAELAKVRAVVPQHASLAVPFPALEVALLGRAPHVIGVESARDVAIARACLERVGLAAFEARLYPTLSGGERQRVHFARALAQLEGESGARALLLDEPTASLDLKHQHETLRLAREVARSGVAVIAVLHDLSLAAQYADRIAVLGAGRLRAIGPAAEVLDERLLTDVFGLALRVVPAPWSPAQRLVVALDPAFARTPDMKEAR